MQNCGLWEENKSDDSWSFWLLVQRKIFDHRKEMGTQAENSTPIELRQRESGKNICCQVLERMELPRNKVTIRKGTSKPAVFPSVWSLYWFAYTFGDITWVSKDQMPGSYRLNNSWNIHGAQRCLNSIQTERPW